MTRLLAARDRPQLLNRVPPPATEPLVATRQITGCRAFEIGVVPGSYAPEPALASRRAPRASSRTLSSARPWRRLADPVPERLPAGHPDAVRLPGGMTMADCSGSLPNNRFHRSRYSRSKITCPAEVRAVTSRAKLSVAQTGITVKVTALRSRSHGTRASVAGSIMEMTRTSTATS